MIQGGLYAASHFSKSAAAGCYGRNYACRHISPAVSLAAQAATQPDSYHDDWLHVNDNAEIVDKDGNPVWITGCNWFGYNVGSQVFDGVWSQNMHDMLRQIADHGFNFLRIPMSTEILLQWKNGDPDPATPKVQPVHQPGTDRRGHRGRHDQVQL